MMGKKDTPSNPYFKGKRTLFGKNFAEIFFNPPESETRERRPENVAHHEAWRL
jgi:hypothetical protein